MYLKWKKFIHYDRGKTFIEIADDCPVDMAEIPPLKGNKKSVANLQYEFLMNNPYQYTSDDILFQVYADKQDLIEAEYVTARELFFSKGQPCFRAFPLTKKYGFGIQSNHKGQTALFGVETEQYANFVTDNTIKKVKAMHAKKV